MQSTGWKWPRDLDVQRTPGPRKPTLPCLDVNLSSKEKMPVAGQAGPRGKVREEDSPKVDAGTSDPYPETGQCGQELGAACPRGRVVFSGGKGCVCPNTVIELREATPCTPIPSSPNNLLKLIPIILTILSFALLACVTRSHAPTWPLWLQCFRCRLANGHSSFTHRPVASCGKASQNSQVQRTLKESVRSVPAEDQPRGPG